MVCGFVNIYTYASQGLCSGESMQLVCRTTFLDIFITPIKYLHRKCAEPVSQFPSGALKFDTAPSHHTVMQIVPLYPNAWIHFLSNFKKLWSLKQNTKNISIKKIYLKYRLKNSSYFSRGMFTRNRCRTQATYHTNPGWISYVKLVYFLWNKAVAIFYGNILWQQW